MVTDALFLTGAQKRLQRVQHSLTQQGETGPTIALPFDEFQFVDEALDLPI